MVLELEGAERVCDAFEGVRVAVGKVVHRIDDPRVAGPVVRTLLDPVEDRVAKSDDGRGHVDLGAQHLLSLVEFSGAHARKEIEVLGDGAIPEGALRSRFGERALVRADLLGVLVVDEGLALLDQRDGVPVERLEVVTREVEVLAPVEPEPSDVGLDPIDVFGVLGRRVRVVEPEVATAVRVLARDPEVEADRHRVSDVQVTVRLRGKARDDLVVLPGSEVLGDDRADEVGTFVAHDGPSLVSRQGIHWAGA